MTVGLLPLHRSVTYSITWDQSDAVLIPQIYLNKDRKASEALLEKVTNYGAAAVMFTVDAAYRSKRTRDVRAKSHVAVSYTHGTFSKTWAPADPSGTHQDHLCI